MDRLRTRLCAKLHVIQEEDAEVAKVIAAPDEIQKVVAARPYDGKVAQWLTAFMWKAALVIGA